MFAKEEIGVACSGLNDEDMLEDLVSVLLGFSLEKRLHSFLFCSVLAELVVAVFTNWLNGVFLLGMYVVLLRLMTDVTFFFGLNNELINIRYILGMNKLKTLK